MNAHCSRWLIPMILAFGFSQGADAQVYRGGSYNPYGSSGRSGNGGGSGGYFGPVGPQVIFGPFGPQASYPTPLGYMVQPAFMGVPYYFGPAYGVNLNGGRVSGSGYMQGSADSLNSSRYQGSSGDVDRRPTQAGGKRAEAKGVEPRRKRFEQFVEERTAGSNDEIKRAQQRELLIRSLVNPSKQEIISGASLNTILESLEVMRPQFREAPEMPMDEELVKQLNFTKGTGTGSFGMLRLEGKVPWPSALLSMTREEAVDLRAAIDKAFLEAYQQVSTGKADRETVQQLQRAVDRLSSLVSTDIRTMDLKDYMEAKQFLKSLDETATFLKQPDAADWLPGKSKIKARTVQELIRVMSEKGIRFAPALVGNDDAYRTVQQMLVTMHNAVAPTTMPEKK